MSGDIVERRSRQRKRALKSAVLHFNNGYGSLEGVVRDISDAGARLRFGDTLAAPPDFVLRIAGTDTAYNASIRWRNSTDIGVQFH